MAKKSCIPNSACQPLSASMHTELQERDAAVAVQPQQEMEDTAITISTLLPSKKYARGSSKTNKRLGKQPRSKRKLGKQHHALHRGQQQQNQHLKDWLTSIPRLACTSTLLILVCTLLMCMFFGSVSFQRANMKYLDLCVANFDAQQQLADTLLLQLASQGTLTLRHDCNNFSMQQLKQYIYEHRAWAALLIPANFTQHYWQENGTLSMQLVCVCVYLYLQFYCNRFLPRHAIAMPCKTSKHKCTRPYKMQHCKLCNKP